MGELVIAFEVDGRLEALHLDKFDLGFLGAKSIARQSSIVWNEMAQNWAIHYHAGEERVMHENLDGFSGYDEAREFEVLWLNNCRLYQVTPESYLGLMYAGYLRYGDKTECFTLPDGSCIGEACMHCVTHKT